MLKAILFALVAMAVPSINAEIQRDTLLHQTIGEVTITTSRTNARLKDLPQKVEVIGPDIISTSPATNVADLLKTHTGLDIIQYPGVSSDIGIRGFSPSAHSRSYTLLLINGVPSATTNAASIPLIGVDRIEIVKGPLAALYGSDAMGGVINIITNEDAINEAGGSFGVSIGSFGARRLTGYLVAPLSNSTAFALGFSNNEQTTDYRIGRRNLLNQPPLTRLILDEASYGDIMLNSKVATNEFTGRVNTSINEKWRANFDVIYFGADGINTPGSYWGVYGQSMKDIHRINLVGTVQGQVNRHTIVLTPYFGAHTRSYFTDNSDTSFVSLDSETREFGLRIHDNIKLSFANILIGADIDIYEYRSRRFGGEVTPANPYQPDYNHDKIAGLVQISRAFNRLHLNAGARWDFIRYELLANEMLNSQGAVETYNTLNPSVGLRYNLPLNFSVKSSFGTGFSVPDAFRVAGFYSVSEYFPEWDFWWVANFEGNPDLKPESSATLDVGLNYANPNRLLTADVTWFRTRHSDRIVEHNFTRQDNQGQEIDITSFRNAGESNHEGIEVMAASDIGALFDNRFRLELYGNFTFMLDATFDQALPVGGSRTFDMLYVRRQTGSFGLIFDNLEGFNTRLNGRYIGQRLERDRFRAIRPAIIDSHYYTGGGYSVADRVLLHPRHVVFDWSLFYTLKGSKRFGISVSNLFDENFTEKDGYNMPGRSIQGSFTYLF